MDGRNPYFGPACLLVMIVALYNTVGRAEIVHERQDKICVKCTCIKRASTIDCERENLTKLPRLPSPCCKNKLDSPMEMNDYKYVDISTNNLTSLPANAFKAISENLHTLMLNRNLIRKIHSKAFGGLSKLIKLELVSNEITHLDSKVFKDLKELDTLKLDKNRIKSLERGLFDSLELVRKVSLRDNFIKHIDPGTFDKMRSLSELDLSANMMYELPTGLFSKLGVLQKLLLNDNYFVSVSPGSFRGLESVVFVNLDANCLQEFTRTELKNMPELRMLTVKDNPLDCDRIPSNTPVTISRCYSYQNETARNKTRDIFNPKCEEARAMEAGAGERVFMSNVTVILSLLIVATFTIMLHF